MPQCYEIVEVIGSILERVYPEAVYMDITHASTSALPTDCDGVLEEEEEEEEEAPFWNGSEAYGCDGVDTQAVRKDQKQGVDVAEDTTPSLQLMDLFVFCVSGRWDIFFLGTWTAVCVCSRARRR